TNGSKKPTRQSGRLGKGRGASGLGSILLGQQDAGRGAVSEARSPAGFAGQGGGSAGCPSFWTTASGANGCGRTRRDSGASLRWRDSFTARAKGRAAGGKPANGCALN
ncbi:MAG TPA: hypothetical protein VEZ90_08265, partial [Blastocatellia bacterium]|nr:hypothetical protein [Blastocatellia bacterium]